MGKYLKSFNSHSEYLEYIQSNDRILPNVSYCINENEVHYNLSWVENYLTFVARENGTISFNIWKSMGTEYITSISYSIDNGETWITTANQNNKSENLVIDVSVNDGDTILWKGVANQLGCWDDQYQDYLGSFFSSDCEFDTEGNVMSLLYGDNFKNQTILQNDCAFCSLFFDHNNVKACYIVNAKNLILPATTLTDFCYHSMFKYCASLITTPKLPATTLTDFCYYSMFCRCTSLITSPELPASTLANNCYTSMFNGCILLTTAPELPATTLANSCYASMFKNCTSLTSTPTLPATTLKDYCYNNMFWGCTSLTSTPTLPATTLATYCYYYMFYGCTSLTTAPELPATSLASYCYEYMFQGCTALTTAPSLPATTLANYCYAHMFQGCTLLTSAPELPATILKSYCYYYMFCDCTALNYIKAMFTTMPSASYTGSWVSGVASSGTFVKNSTALWNVTGNNGIPNNWTVRTE